MSLSEEIVSKLDKSHEQLIKVYEKLNPKDYTKSYQKIWSIRAEIEFIVISLKLLNNLDSLNIDEKWKEEFSSSLKQVRAERKIRQAFLETIDLFSKLESIEDIMDFYKICWMLKEKLTILLNVVKPKIKLKKNDSKSINEKK
ncbi:MAG: hypothetical protein FK730_04345 [Asgard group archaeon]|nr:hypothetical protein [Asgard group archaeon]